MRWVADGIWLLAAAVAYGTLGEVLAVRGTAPVLPVVLLVRVSLVSGTLSGNLVGFVTGFLLDLFAFQWFGAAMLVDSIIGFVVGALRNRVVIDSASVRFAVLLVAAEAHALGLVLVRSVAGPVGPEPFLAALGGGLYTAIVGAVWWALTGTARSAVGWRSVWYAER